MVKKILFVLLFILFLPISAKARTLSCTKYVDMGEFKLTAYCPCEECSDGYDYKTATGTIAKEQYTVAVDPKVISYGSKVLIGDIIFTAEDCGEKVVGDHIDIFMKEHSKVKNFGVKYTQIYIIKGEYEY